jgi:hypothetical protein
LPACCSCWPRREPPGTSTVSWPLAARRFTARHGASCRRTTADDVRVVEMSAPISGALSDSRCRVPLQVRAGILLAPLRAAPVSAAAARGLRAPATRGGNATG